MGLPYKYNITAKNGRYYVIITYKDKDGKRRIRWKKTGTTDRREAEQAAPKIANDFYKAATRTAETVEEVAEEWKNAAIGVIDPVTLDGYKILLNSYILPYIGNCKISEITAENVTDLYKTLLTEGRRNHCGGLKRESVKKARSVLVHILKHAEQQCGAITTDERRILESAEIPKTHEQKTRPNFYTAEELRALLEEAKKNKVIYFCVFFASVYGLRRSEIAGIKWGAVDFKTKTLFIQHTVTEVTQRREMDRTKTAASKRAVPLTAEAMEIIRALYPTEPPTAGEYVLKGPNGQPIRPDYITKAFKALAKRAGVPPLRFHDLRHSCAASLLSNGWGLYDVKEYLGHAKIETTANIYGHIETDRRKAMGQDLEGRILENNRKSSRKENEQTKFIEIDEHGTRQEKNPETVDLQRFTELLSVLNVGGDKRDRTADLLNAIQYINIFTAETAKILSYLTNQNEKDET